MGFIKKIILFSFAIALHIVSYSQSYLRTFGGTGSETGTCIKTTLDGNYVISGLTTGSSNGYEDAFMMKMSSSGNLLWSKAYGGTYKDRAYYVSTCSDGGFILTGYTSLYTNGSNNDVYLLRTDSNGNLSWSRSYGGSADDHGWYTDQTNDGGFITVGATRSFNIGNWDGYVIKTDASGTLQWSKVIGGSNSDYFHGMSKTNDGGIIITGVTSTNSFGSSDIWLVKLNSDGDTTWTRQYGKITEDAGNAVIQTADGGYMIAGDIHINVGSGDHNSCLLKTDALGNLQWVKTYGSNPGTEIAWDVRQTPDNGYIFSGASAFYGNGGGGDILTIRTDVSGNVQWAKAYGGSLFDDFWYSQPTPDKGNVMVGLSHEGGQNILVVSTDSLGNSACRTTTVIPDVNNPVMQVRSGNNVTAVNLSGTPATNTYSASINTNDPCSVTSAIENESNEISVTLSPNPFSENTFLNYSSALLQKLSLKLFNIWGQEVQTDIISQPHGFLIHRGSLPAGIYFYILSDNTESVASGKFVIE